MAVWVFSPGLSQEASLAPSLIWPGRSGLGACRCAPPPSTTTEGWGPAGHLGLWGCRGRGRTEGGGWDSGLVPIVTCATWSPVASGLQGMDQVGGFIEGQRVERRESTWF